MRPPALLTSENFKSFPVTAGLAFAAVLASVARWSGEDVSWLYSDIRAFHGEPLRLVTSTLLHVDVVHLALNCFWLWVFGNSTEAVFGHLKTAAIFLLLAVGSSAVAGAVGEDGIGLSGVGYGLFGLLWILSREDERFQEAIDAQTTALFVAWFFFCIIVTWIGVWHIGNVAHGAGAALGVLTGLAIARPARRALFAGAVACVMVLAMVTGFLWRPYLPWGHEPGQELAFLGYQALQRGQPQHAVDLLEEALARDDRQAHWWYNLSIAYATLDRRADAENAMRRAFQIKPGQSDWRQWLAQFAARAGYDSAVQGNHTVAVKRYREALDLDESKASTWYNLGVSYDNLGDQDAARSAYLRAAELEPNNPIYQIPFKDGK